MGKSNKKKKGRPSSSSATEEKAPVTNDLDSAKERFTTLAAYDASRPAEDYPVPDMVSRARGIGEPLLAAAGGDMISFTNYVMQQNIVAEKLAEIFPLDEEGQNQEQKPQLAESQRGRKSETGNILQEREQSPKTMMYEAIAEHLADNRVGVGRKNTAEGYKKLEALGLFSDTKGNLQRELRERKLLLLAKDRAKVLSLQDVSEHNIFMIGVRDKLGQRRDALTKRARVISVLLNKTRDARRVAALEADMEKIRVAERNFNEDIAAFNGELTWFHSCPSFRKAQEHVAQHWVSLGSGEGGLYVPRSEIEQDEAATFEAMLEEMKLDGLGSPGAFDSGSKDSIAGAGAGLAPVNGVTAGGRR